MPYLPALVLVNTVVPLAASTGGRIAPFGSLAACTMTATEGNSVSEDCVQPSPTSPVASTARVGMRKSESLSSTRPSWTSSPSFARTSHQKAPGREPTVLLAPLHVNTLPFHA